LVVLPDTDADPYEPTRDLVCIYELGIVASGLLTTNGSEEELPALHAGVVYEDVSVGGTDYQKGDRFLSYESGGDTLPTRLGGADIEQVYLRAYFDGTNRLYLAYRLSSSNAWNAVADFEVQVRGGPSARAEIRGGASNLVLSESAAGAITDFRIRQTYDAWLDERGVAIHLRGVNADPDSDGLRNLEEYGLAFDPLVADATGWLHADATSRGDHVEVGLTHHHSRTAETTFRYEGSSDLNSWNVGPTVGALDLVDLDPGSNGRAYCYRTPLATTGNVGYLRVRVWLP
jgi:hypothetical protein